MGHSDVAGQPTVWIVSAAYAERLTDVVAAPGHRELRRAIGSLTSRHSLQKFRSRFLKFIVRFFLSLDADSFLSRPIGRPSLDIESWDIAATWVH